MLGWIPVRAGGPPAPDYFFENWLSAEGADLSAVTAILQTHDGYLWLGTYNGLVRFDGTRFVVFNLGGASGLRNGRITALFEDARQVLWIGHETGDLTRWEAGRFSAEPLAFPWVGGPIESIKTDDQGELWLGSVHGGVFRLRDGQCSLLDVAKKGWPVWMAKDGAGFLWVVSNGTVGRIKAGIFDQLQLDGKGADTNNYERVLPLRDGGIWLQRNGEIGIWRHGDWALPPRPAPWRNDHTTTDLLETASGELLVGTMRNGLFVVSPGGEVKHFTRSEGLSSDQIRSLVQDREGNVWIGTGDGLNTMRRRKVQMLIAPDRWKGYKVLGFAPDRDGSVWVGTQGAGLYHCQGPDWTTYDSANGLASMFVWSLLERKSGELLVGSWNNGIVSRRDGRFAAGGELAHLQIPAVALYEDAQGCLWVGTQDGLAFFADGRLNWVAGKEQFKIPDVRAIAEATDGSIWFGLLGGGLGRLANGKVTAFGKADGLASDFVQALYADPDGVVWVGTTDAGLCCRRAGKFVRFGVEQGIPGNSICHIVDDGAGNLWLGTQHGISRVSKRELELGAEGGKGVLNCLTYGKSEGLTSQTCSGGFQPAACRTADGRLWFSTVKGIAIIDPAQVTTNAVPPPVVIEEFKVAGKPFPRASRTGTDPRDAPAALEIPPGGEQIEINWTALSFAAPDRVRFKYQLEGLETRWGEPTSQRGVQYSYLRPGNYVFRVIACNNDGVWNESGAALGFAVLPHFWETWWFDAGTAIAGALLVGGGVWSVARRRAQRKLQLLERQQAVEQERARIARDIHDDLGASLTRITMLSHTVSTEFQGDARGAAAAGEVHRTARELTRALDEIVWAVDPRHDSLDSLANYLGGYAQDFLSAAGIACRLDLPMRLPDWTMTAEVRHKLFLAFKEALHNVVKHARAREVAVSLEFRGRGFVVKVADDGRGFGPPPDAGSTMAATPAKSGAAGHGLANMRNRLAEIGGHCEWESRPGLGTQVRLVVGGIGDPDSRVSS